MTDAAKRIKLWRENPAQFVVDNFKVEPDEWQLDALKLLGGSFNPRRRVMMKACTGPGKSAVLAWAGWHRLSCFAKKGEFPKGVALSGEGRDNLRDNLWAELAKWQERSEFLKRAFTWNKGQIVSNEAPDTWFLSARSYAKDADTEAVGRSLSGLHSQFPFVLLDETGDMPVTVGQKAAQIFTGGVVDAIIIGAGNPTSTSGLLYHTCTVEREQWSVVTVTADPADPKRTPRVDIEHAKEQIRIHGRDNPWVMATILGQFPHVGFNQLLGPDDVEAAMRRHLAEDKYSHSQRRLGVDVARFGDDRTVIFPRQGLAAFTPIEIRGARTNEIAAKLVTKKLEWGSEMEFVDDTGGWGSGVIDSLIQANQPAIPINFAGKPLDHKFHNRRAEMWFGMADWVKRGGALPNIPSLARELTLPTYAFINGKFLLESKEQIKDRLGFSPDLADALCLTFALPEMPRTLAFPGIKTKQKLLAEYDPFSDPETNRLLADFDPF